MCMEDVRLARETVTNAVILVSPGIGANNAIGSDTNRLSITVTHDSGSTIQLQSVRSYGGAKITLAITPTFGTRTFTIDEIGDCVWDAWVVVVAGAPSFVMVSDTSLRKQ